MSYLLGSVPATLLEEVSEQRYFQQAVRMALTSHDRQTVSETAGELRRVSANAPLAIQSARLRSDVESDWVDCERLVAVQSLAADAGADLLDQTARALAAGEQAHRQFRARLRALLGLHIPDGEPPAQ
jgi:hypothetical protein